MKYLSVCFALICSITWAWADPGPVTIEQELREFTREWASTKTVDEIRATKEIETPWGTSFVANDTVKETLLAFTEAQRRIDEAEAEIAHLRGDDIAELTFILSSFPPFAFKDKNDGYTHKGHDVDLAHQIGDRLGRDVKVLITSDLNEVFEDVNYDRIGGGGLTITYGREKDKGDFTHSTYISSLGVLVSDSNPGILNVAVAWITTPGRAVTLAIYFGFLFFCALVIWAAEQKSEGFQDGWKGLIEAFEFSIVTGSTVGYGNMFPKRFRSRVVTMCIIMIGVPFFAWFIGSFASVAFNNNPVTSLSDLNDKVVVVKAGTVGEDYLRSNQIEYITVKSTEEGCKMIASGEADALVGDVPALKTQNCEGTKLADFTFYPQNYGFLLPAGHPLKDEINEAILWMQENGIHDKIKDKWGI